MTALRDFLMQNGGIPMYVIFLIILLTFLAVMVVKERVEAKRQVKDAAPLTEKEKCRNYLQGVAMLWGTVLVVFAMCYIGGIRLADIGFRPLRLGYGFWFTAATLTLGGVAIAYFLYNIVGVLVSEKFRKKGIKTSSSAVLNAIPRTKRAKWLFSLLALSAGVCEEIVFRGFFLFLILSIFPELPVWLAALIPIVLFGLAHLYQGLQGVVSTAVVGAIFMCLYLATDSLLLAMVLHFLMDVVAAFVLKEEDEMPVIASL
ncbi:MAG: CPBP family intramembrane metalloprotease [Prevotellaceae bacterium]|jgi:membrane protease YdiL (CAAX protease family)|nr:CPBP family intramembrane metalloprotease [Prevotellaceae bacterium]